MSYCRYTTNGNYICDNIEHLKSVKKSSNNKNSPIDPLIQPIQQIKPDFSNFKKCKKIINNDIIDILPVKNNSCKKLASATLLNDYFFKKSQAQCNIIEPTYTLYPNADFNVRNFIDNTKYNNDNKLLSINKTICKLNDDSKIKDINNDVFILCNKSNNFTPVLSTEEECFTKYT